MEMERRMWVSNDIGRRDVIVGRCRGLTMCWRTEENSIIRSANRFSGSVIPDSRYPSALTLCAKSL